MALAQISKNGVGVEIFWKKVKLGGNNCFLFFILKKFETAN
jgi:hypothetical protein